MAGEELENQREERSGGGVLKYRKQFRKIGWHSKRQTTTEVILRLRIVQRSKVEGKESSSKGYS